MSENRLPKEANEIADDQISKQIEEQQDQDSRQGRDGEGEKLMDAEANKREQLRLAANINRVRDECAEDGEFTDDQTNEIVHDAMRLAELVEALKNNWEGKEDLRLMFTNAPHFGNDDDYVDLIGRDFMRMNAELVHSFKNIWGYPFTEDGRGGKNRLIP